MIVAIIIEGDIKEKGDIADELHDIINSKYPDLDITIEISDKGEVVSNTRYASIPF
jgi:hypothetical protein